MIIFHFCADSAANVSCPQLDADLAKHSLLLLVKTCYLCMHRSSSTFSVSQPVFWFTACGRQRTAVCPETTGSVSVEEQQTTHHTHVCWYFYEVTLVIFNSPCRHRKMMSCVVVTPKIPCHF